MKPADRVHSEPEPVRRELAEWYRKLAEDRRHTRADRAEFRRIAAAWAATLPQRKAEK